jgi:hypothetical protein
MKSTRSIPDGEVHGSSSMDSTAGASTTTSEFRLSSFA